MNAIFRNLIFPLVLICWATAAMANQWAGKQGDVLHIHFPATPQATSHTVTVFNKSWPVFTEEDGLHCWIGIDLKTEPGNYNMVFLANGSKIASLDGAIITVEPGGFRESHITVEKKMSEFDEETLATIKQDRIKLNRAYRAPSDLNSQPVFKQMPVDQVVSSPFGSRRFVNGNPRSPHNGVDIAAEIGTPILAPMAGKVVLSDSQYLNGNIIVLAHGHKLYSVYIHLDTMDIAEGSSVRAGDRIGSVGNTGRTTGPNLHWGVRFNGARVNPLSLLNAPL